MFSNDIATPSTIAILSVLSLVAGPLLCILAVSFTVARRRKPRPLVLAVIPLALTSISIQLAAATLTILSGFRNISEQKATGVAAVMSIFTAANNPLFWRFVEVAVCVAIASIIAPWVRSREGKEMRGSPVHSLTTIAWSAAALVAVIALVWFYRDIVELCMMVVDRRRAAEAAAKLGNLGIAGLSAMLASHIVIVAFCAWVVTQCLVGIGFSCLHADRRTRWGSVGSVVVVAAALAWCGMSVSAESRAQSYLEGIGYSSGPAPPIYHTYYRFGSGIDNFLDYFREPPPPSSDWIVVPPPPPPPPPPPAEPANSSKLKAELR